MRSPFAVALGLVLVAAAAAGYVGPLYAESAESCGSLLLPATGSVCDVYERRRWILLALLVGCSLPLLLAGLSRRPSDRLDGPRSPLAGTAAGLLVLPVALVLFVPLFFLDQAVYGFTQAFTGVPYVFAPAVLAVGALVAARVAVRAGADAGTALAAAAVGLPLVLSVQAVVEAFRWRLDDLPTPLLLSGTFSYDQPDDAVTLLTLGLSALPVCLALGLATRSRRRLRPGLAAGLLGLSALVAGVLFEGTDGGGVYSAASIEWLPVVLLPAVVAMAAVVRAGAPSAATAGRATSPAG